MGLEKIVVVGGSLAGLRAAEALRARRWGGLITMVSAEKVGPYNRPPLSKHVLRGEMELGEILFDTPAALGLDWRRGVTASALDTERRTVMLGSGELLRYDGLIVATGARPRLPAIPGARRSGVHVLRTYDDATALRADLHRGASLVVLGAGFIGCEVAASARSLGVEVAMIDPAPAPLSRALDRRLGDWVADLHRLRGVDLRLGRSVASIDGGARVEAVILDDGTRLPADAVLVCVGAVPAIEWLEGSGLPLGDGVLCDRSCRVVGHTRIVAAGDVASWPHEGLGGRRMRVEHWSQAGEQAEHAAAALLDPTFDAPFRPVPSVWSDQYDKKIQILGAPTPGSRTEIAEGSLESGRFLATVWDDAHLVGVVSVGMPGRLAAHRPRLAAEIAP